jgi:hypothetical protein
MRWRGVSLILGCVCSSRHVILFVRLSACASAILAARHQRSTAVGLVVSGFGLSAFFFSTIAHTAFSDDTSAFLAVLALGTTIPNVLAYFIVRIVPHDERPDPVKEQRAGYAIIGDDSHDGIYSPVGLERRLNELDEERRNSDPTHTYTETTASPPPHSRNHHNTTPDRWHSNRTRGRSSAERTRSRSPTSSLDLPSEFGNIASSAAEIPHIAMSHNLEDIPEHPRTRSSSALDIGLDHGDLLPSNGVGDPESIPALLRRRDFWLMCGVVSLRKFICPSSPLTAHVNF